MFDLQERCDYLNSISGSSRNQRAFFELPNHIVTTTRADVGLIPEGAHVIAGHGAIVWYTGDSEVVVKPKDGIAQYINTEECWFVARTECLACISTKALQDEIDARRLINSTKECAGFRYPEGVSL